MTGPLNTPASFRRWFMREVAKGSLTLRDEPIARLAFTHGHMDHAASVVRSGSAAAGLIKPEWFEPQALIQADAETVSILLVTVRALLVDNQRLATERLAAEREASNAKAWRELMEGGAAYRVDVAPDLIERLALEAGMTEGACDALGPTLTARLDALTRFAELVAAASVEGTADGR